MSDSKAKIAKAEKQSAVDDDTSERFPPPPPGIDKADILAWLPLLPIPDDEREQIKQWLESCPKPTKE